tara:strand:+ start:349 stop:969 length:621 start_codon:yes stop_codon:yes gene_type:complete
MRNATEVFGEWAENGKDEGMEKGHASSVNAILKFALEERILINKSFNFLDLGCGNGWVVRKLINEPLCNIALGVDGAEQMISNAKKRGEEENYIHSDIEDYQPCTRFDLVHSMEVMYYLSDPLSIIKKIEDSWLNPDGRLIIGLDLYYENKDSHSWEAKVNTPMLMLKESEWIDLFNQAGFLDVESWQVNKSQDWAGTLVVTGKKS